MLQSLVPPLTIAPSQRSRGHGRLSVKSLTGKSRIDRLFQEGCARIRIPTSHDQDGLEAVMINTAGGMTGGDKFDWEFTAGINTSLNVTTQACERIYKSAGGTAKTNIRLTVETGARLAWLPQETILFDQGQYQRQVTLEMAEKSQLLFVEPVILGRGEMGESVNAGSFRDLWRFSRGGRLFHAENFVFKGDIADQVQKAAIANGNCAFATVLLVAPDAETKLDTARKIIGKNGGASFWESAECGKLLARVMAKDGYNLRKALIPLINLLNDGASLPKCWSL